jgi:hypothetical protein
VSRHRVHVLPWLRRPGGLLLREWLGITIGHHIFCWRTLDAGELEHELEHVRQWRRHGLRFPVLYFAGSLQARRAGGHWYRDNRFEAGARKAADRIEKR